MHRFEHKRLQSKEQPAESGQVKGGQRVVLVTNSPETVTGPHALARSTQPMHFLVDISFSSGSAGSAAPVEEGKGKKKVPSTQVDLVEVPSKAEEPLEEVFGGPREKRDAEILRLPVPKRAKDTRPEIPTVMSPGGVEVLASYTECLMSTRSVVDARVFSSLNHQQRLSLARSNVAMVPLFIISCTCAFSF